MDTTALHPILAAIHDLIRPLEAAASSGQFSAIVAGRVGRGVRTQLTEAVRILREIEASAPRVPAHQQPTHVAVDTATLLFSPMPLHCPACDKQAPNVLVLTVPTVTGLVETLRVCLACLGRFGGRALRNERVWSASEWIDPVVAPDAPIDK